MKEMKKIKLFIGLFIVSMSVAYAQIDDSNILPLNDCLHLALVNAPELTGSLAIIEQAKAEEIKFHTFWLWENTSTFAGASYIDRRKLDSRVNDLNPTSTFFGPQTEVRVGLLIDLPLSTWKYKKQDKIIATYIVKEQNAMYETIVIQIQNEVIRLYNLYQTASIVLRIKSTEKQVQKSVFDEAQLKLQNNDPEIDLEKFSNIVASYSNAQTSFEESRANLENSYKALELRVGQTIENE